MAHTLYEASAPGSLMLFGEHAVLAGKRALVVSVNQRIKATLIPRDDNIVQLISALGKYEGTVEDIGPVGTVSPKAPFHFVLTAISVYREKLQSGFDLHIKSDFSSTLGLGSSAAVVVAVLRVMSKYVNDNEKRMNEKIMNENEALHSLFKQARTVVETVQGQASGADVAASVFGGVVLYRKDPLLINLFPVLPPLVASYVGYKTPTTEVIQKVKTCFEESQYLLECLFDAMEACTETALLALQQQDWCTFGHCMNVGHGLLNALGVSDAALDQVATQLRHQEGILGTKISGAGLGDCVIGIGKIPEKHIQDEHKIKSLDLLKIEPCLQGVCDA